MAMAQPLRNQNKEMVLSFGPMFLVRNKTTKSANKGQGNGNSVRTLCKQGRLKEALHNLHVMDRLIDCSTYAFLLQGCVSKSALPDGKLVHAHITEKGLMRDRFLGNTLMNMYSKCGTLADARKVFDQMPERNVFSWTIMIGAYARHEPPDEEALTLFHQMQRTGIQPNQFTFASVLPACGNLEDLADFHKEIIRSGFDSDVFVGNALVDMYGKYGSIENARHVFDKIPQRDLVSWNTMIGVYAQNGYVNDATELFQKAPVLDVISWNTMIAGYAQNGFVDEALKCFQKMPKRNVVSWTAMIAGYAENGHDEETLKLFREMQLAGVKPNLITFASVLRACASLGDLERGIDIHEEIIRSGFHSDVIVESALVDMYAKCGRIEKARSLFDKMHQRTAVSWTAMIAGYSQNGHVDEALKLFQKMPERDVVSWTTMIAGYAQNGHGEESLKLFLQMKLAGVKPDSKTFASVLPACATLAALEQGMEIHEEIIRGGFQRDVTVANALVDMYAKCGSIDNARDVFDKIHQRTVVSWNAIISGYAMHGCGKEALKLFEQMQQSGIKPDHVTLVGILSACCHAGLVNEGWQYFNCMSQYYHITPAMEHYGCMVALLGRAGCLDEALDFINKMPIKPDANVWGSLLGACRIHNNIKLGEHVANHLFELDPKNDIPYVILSNMYAAASKWDASEKVWKMMKDRRIKKKPGCSWIEINKQMHAFLVGDR
eukprot:Gb_19896 [translate_table: standard]